MKKLGSCDCTIYMSVYRFWFSLSVSSLSIHPAWGKLNKSNEIEKFLWKKIMKKNFKNPSFHPVN